MDQSIVASWYRQVSHRNCSVIQPICGIRAKAKAHSVIPRRFIISLFIMLR